MIIKKTALNKVLIIVPDLFFDHRGKYIETYNEQEYFNKNINIKFIQDDVSYSKKNVLRGIHGDTKTWKLVSCLKGDFFLVIVNNDPESNEYKKWISFTLSEKNYFQVLIPPKFGNGHLALSDTIFHYKQSTYYDYKNQFTIMWNDNNYNINWPIKNPILSNRDKGQQNI